MNCDVLSKSLLRSALIGTCIFLLFCTDLNNVESGNTQVKQVTNTKEIQDLFDTIDNNKEEHIEFLKELIKAQDEGEEAVQTLVAKRFEELGCTVEVLRIFPANIKMEHEFAAEEAINNRERNNRRGYVSRYR